MVMKVKQWMKITLLILAVAVVLSVVGAILYKHLVTDRITDKGGMENPYVEQDIASGSKEEGKSASGNTNVKDFTDEKRSDK